MCHRPNKYWAQSQFFCMRRGGFAEKGYNTPCRIGHAICLPGDVVYGCQSGVYFIPAHLAEEVVNDAERVHVKDMFGFQRVREGRYNI